MAKRIEVLERLPFAPIVAALFACVAIVLVAATPQWLFERWVALSGIAAIIPAATPPLGEKARIAAAVFAGAATGGLVWLMVAIGEKRLRGAPMTRTDRGTAIPSPIVAPHRRPLFADTELGAPLMSDEAMTQAREELVLDMPIPAAEVHTKVTPMAPFEPGHWLKVDEVEGYVPLEMPDKAPDEAHPGEDERVEARQPVRLRPVAQETIPTLLDRLDAAIARKPPGFRPDRSDLATLRRALGR